MRRAAVLAALAACSPSGPRDVAGENRPVRVAPEHADAGAPEAYAYVARRPHGVVALAEARNMTDEDAREIVERLATELEACASRLEGERSLVDGAARIVAVVQPDGIPALKVVVEPGGAIAQNALMCLVAPVRAITFPKGAGKGPPGMAIEATWGPRGQVDAGRPL